ncbi:transmembrane protein 45B [Senna tora]|uniref:Transmembrane protein 45B n=1 Tax=Senna tora TaxID=362788 RepID=A0A834SXV1_9FABA|nr:transmembrane protein 45B [Senna tora]
MGTFVGHIVPGLALTLLGLWHTINTIKAYFLKGPSNFTVRFWYQFTTLHSKLKHLELISILSFSILAIFIQILDFPFFRFAFKLDNFEHASMFMHLAVFASFTLCAEFFTDSSSEKNLLSGFIGILASSVFGQELFLLHFHSTDHVGLEGHYHWLLQLIVLISLLASIAATSFPTSFPAALVLSISVMLQGCWFLNMGFMLWVPAFVPQGCTMNDLTKAISGYGHGHGHGMVGAITCASDEADFRARALANLQFSWTISAILILSGLVCLKSARKPTNSERLTEYQRLHSRVADSIIISTEVLKKNKNMKREERFKRMEDTGGIHRRRTTLPEIPPAHFFKIILPTTILDKKLRIPMTFIKDQGDGFSSSSIVTLSDPNLREWKIGLEKSEEEEDVWLSEGWEKFMEYYSITKQNILVFRYEGGSKFHVLIFDMSGSEIQYPHHHHHLHRHPKPNIKLEREEVISLDSTKDNDHDHHQWNKNNNNNDDDYDDHDYEYVEEEHINDDDDDDAYYIPSPSKSPSPVFTPRRRGFTKFMDQGPRRERERESGRGRGREKQYAPSSSNFGFRRKRKRHNIVSESEYSESDEEVYNNHHHHHYHGRRGGRSNGGRSGIRVKKEENVEWVGRETCKSKSYRKRKITARESERVMQAAREYISEFPSFMAVLRPHNLYNSFVYVPATFATKYLDGRSELVTLETWEGKQWCARCIYRRGSGCGRSIGRGWAKFAMDNAIQEGDVCVFELVSRIDIILRVGIFRLSNFVDR